MNNFLAIFLFLTTILTGCTMEKVPETAPEQLEAERYESILEKFRVEPTDEPVSTCLDVKIKNLSFNSQEWVLELPKISSDKPNATAPNETIFTKYTERFRTEIEELTEARQTPAQYRTFYSFSALNGLVYIKINVDVLSDGSYESESIYFDLTNDKELDKFEFFDACTGNDHAISDWIEFAKKLYGVEFSTEDIDDIELSGSTLGISFGDYSLNIIAPGATIPGEVQLPEGEPVLERAPSFSGLKFRYYAGDGAKFYWSRTGEIWFNCTIDLPENAKNIEITDFQNGNSCETNITLKADIDGISTNFDCIIDAYFMPLQQVNLGTIGNSNS